MEGRWKVVLSTVPVAIPTLFLATIDYSFLWRYVGWSNQVVATVMLWTAAMYLLKSGKIHWIAGIPAIFMTGVTTSYIFYAPEGFKLAYNTSMIIGLILTATVIVWYVAQIISHRRSQHSETVLKSA
jgi:carbon starvation protein CstA